MNGDRRRLGSLVVSLVAGRLAAKMDPRCPIAAAFAILCATNLWTGSMTLAISPTSLFWPIVITGFTFPLICVCLSGISLGTLPQSELGNASEIYNLLRNLGGSIGIAAASTISQRHLQTHRSEMSHWISGARGALRAQLTHFNSLMRLHAGPVKASLRSAALVQKTLDSQPNSGPTWTDSGTSRLYAAFAYRLSLY